MAFFVPPAQAIIHKELNLLYQVTTTPQSTPISPQFWIHTELVSSLGPLEYVLNTASHHRVHHGANRWATIPYHGLTSTPGIAWTRTTPECSLSGIGGAGLHTSFIPSTVFLVSFIAKVPFLLSQSPARMFGTFEAERGDVELVYGLVDQPQFWNPVAHQVSQGGSMESC